MPDAARLEPQITRGTIARQVTGTTVMIATSRPQPWASHVCPASDGPKPHVAARFHKGCATELSATIRPPG